MESTKPSFTILITTKNRIKDLKITLAKCTNLFSYDQVDYIICDDGSTDGSSDFISKQYPFIQLIQNKESKGLIYSRNRLLDLVTTPFAISLDDDAHFITQNPLQIISAYFDTNPACGLLAFRIFWGLEEPINTRTNEKNQLVQSFVGCGHVWRMEAWRSIANYPEWFEFYGEEDFASYLLFQNNWSIQYVPDILVQHRVSLKGRKNDPDYKPRLRRSLRSGWYLLFMFTPLYLVPRKFLYSIWMQLKLKVFKGELYVLQVLVLALKDVLINFPKLIKDSNRLSPKQWKAYSQISRAKIYWQPEKNNPVQ
ncbi:glycosyltransferase [Flavobacterium sp. F-380]|uniref:Glycosyltransferase n=1 Tax=Flavobacterium kayseriense TaxID=2764714 RepID=A0ABR7J8B6_9FLAO|nr:glycosyltransferase [Flavobacterium kayseriense]MBC5841432.1 glycosyltransferase [Flavobacterium kayseriense]MBC5847960.1 glycosyltransferase [Flavobacterium kayseriense]